MKRSGTSTAAKTVEGLETRFRQSGLPLTVQRRVILDALLKRDDHPTADQIFVDVKDRIPGVSRTTVYRVLDTLVGLGMARRASHLGAAARFDPNTEHHHHLVCLRCDKVMDFENVQLDPLVLPDTHRAGFDVLDYSVHFLGLCSQCRREKTATSQSKERTRGKKSRDEAP